MSVAMQKTIERVDSPNPDTDERAEMADVIEEHYPAKNLNQCADMAGYSRQHAKNTLESHFREVERTENEQDQPEKPRATKVTIEVPDDIDDPPSYLQGYVNGFRDGWVENQ